ncbi:protein of unknown function (plasmid) [Cupriavidus taiwanensis]|uniref:6,7-dimethyl-8-ribityllumazine synthase n=1 Tax=Cupriavidus taiwanensis TaxID=164546 RepID=A0A375HFW6_9BURK|nr:protein of unknown function [Cupriavidus taiwanensis]SOZ72461.1 protein of unknown function [Cupriavidus taiwanensis]SOZ74872.1 protein of unknown function [Cupriavidus taiwanensis]SPA03662.1 protein of unknown function [Cupriavidus taiwanensis]SPA11558.1 protein of unknown function [Cupriavidus taiwanensis]
MKTDIFSPTTRVAFIQTEWHKTLLEHAREGFLRRMVELGVDTNAVDFFEVPGPFEIPLFAKRFAARGAMWRLSEVRSLLTGVSIGMSSWRKPSWRR